ncbi:bifunctional pantoate--beta-alanine ligase/(d)CMP kinase [Gloeocapsa sp. PCC 73106]|uniref:bifunctional pantoate--beta-alanine ligase/(d)CMP kinase n=1 Tax=Gloeocapsa sp. PCC 73106 TaxID=102232 RepID=UPI0002ACE6E3|nr:bifunctional pantoate--beta-alanine ligase/(d)CMP kinase [Gloeocapsa sp. PCC 73106]ELR99312.1 cytidylate kinase/pantoate--beta-alanine ligase [Gloeocapsa sp. PCC 73106]
MRLFTTVSGLRSSLAIKSPEQTIGLVPTMGSLHSGHLSLIKRAVSENDLVVVSIFVNPLQFGPQEDWDKYPQTLEVDSELCAQRGVDLVFAPKTEEMGITQVGQTGLTTAVVPPQGMTSVLCGPFRPVHFTGVATIVTQLFQIVQPNIAYFGQKDAQQLAIIRRLAQDLHFSTEIRGCPTVREVSGLAYSSRNQYLSSQEKVEATVLYRSLTKAQSAFQQGAVTSNELITIVKQELASVSSIRVEYVEVVDPDTLIPLTHIERSGLLAIALWIGSTRLIDNIVLRLRQPIIAIDGPAGAGKSTVTRHLAQTLGFLHLDTGAMYRAVTWLIMHQGIDLDDTGAIAELLSDLRLELIPDHNPTHPSSVVINGHNVSEAVRSLEVTKNVSKIAALNAVRCQLVKLQKSFGIKGGLVAEGRDIGTNVFPDAELKIFLTASVEERSQRRLKELESQGLTNVNQEELAREIQARDELDSQRKVSPLQQATDAIVISSDGLSVEEVTAKIVELYQGSTIYFQDESKL